MTKTQNSLGQYVIKADTGNILTNGEIYTLVYISDEDINESDWTEVDISEVPVNDEISDSEALAIITGGAV